MFIPEEDSDAFRNFSGSVHSRYTLSFYCNTLEKFKKFCDVTTYSQLLTIGKKDKVIEAKIQAFILHEKKRKIRAQTLSGNISALWHFYQFNDRVGINWTKLRAFIGEPQRAVKDRAPRVEEIRQILDHAELREKLCVLLMVSAGMRIGALVGLEEQDFKRIEKFDKITVYRGTPDEYTTFCTPEASRAKDEYFAYRQREGETITPTSPIIRERIALPKQPRKLTAEGLESNLRLLYIKSGVRQVGKPHERKEVMANHGFRKYFKQQLRRSNIHPVLVERLVGHKSGDVSAGVTKLSLTYDPEDHEEMLREYVKAIDTLTISTERKLRLEKEEIEKKLAGEAGIKKMIEDEIAKYVQLSKSSQTSERQL